jgi:hypothetical protein
MDIKIIEVVKDIIRKTKNEVREEERKKAIIQKFKEIFGFEPNLIIWTDNLTLLATYRVTIDEIDDEEFDLTIEGKRVVEILFKIQEEIGYNGCDVNWTFLKSKRSDVICYQFVKNYDEYTAYIEIITIN